MSCKNDKRYDSCGNTKKLKPIFLTTLLLSYAVGYATGYAVGAVIETIAELISPSTIQQGIRDRGAFTMW